MRYSLIHRTAVLIDQFIDAYKKARKRKRFPHKEVGRIIHFLFPRSSPIGRGAWKTVYKVPSRIRDLVLKTSSPRVIRYEERAYNRLPRNVRNRYFAKVYWRTRYCLLQKYGIEGRVPPELLRKLQAVGGHHGLTDIRPENIRKVGGVFKIVDANISKRRP